MGNQRKLITAEGVGVIEPPTPCPYCADPALLDAPKGEPDEETSLIPNGGGRFWAEGEPSRPLTALSYGKRWTAKVPPKYFNKRLAGFSTRVVGVEIGFFLPLATPPPPFSGHVLTHLRTRQPHVRPPAKSSGPMVAYVLFSGVVIEHAQGGAEVRAHWWPSHGWRVELRTDLTTDTAEARNAQLQTALDALEFFRLEARGSQKIKAEEFFRAVKALGPKATQTLVAERLGVSDRAVRDWVKREGWTWGKLKRDYLRGEVV